MTFVAHWHSEKLTNLWIRWASYFWYWATSPRQTDWFSACIQWYTISTHWCHSVDIRKGGDSTRLWCCHWWWQNTESVWFPWLRQTQGWVMKCWGWINKKFKTCISCLVVRMLRKLCNQIQGMHCKFIWLYNLSKISHIINWKELQLTLTLTMT